MAETDLADDLELAAQVCLGNSRAFEQIVRRHQTRIRAFCRHMLADQALAEDAAQEVFVRAWRSIKSFTPKPSLSAWLFRIARNQCIYQLRRRRSSDSVSLETGSGLGAADSTAALPAADLRPPPAETREFLVKLLQSLSQTHREVILLREMQGLSYEEIAESLECSIDSVKGRLKRAREELAAKMRHFSYFSDVVIRREDDHD